MLSKFFKKWVFIFFAFSLLSFYTVAEEFKFKFSEGDSFKINSFVEENVYVNNEFSHFSTIINRITADVSDIRKDDDGFFSALYTCTFMTSEEVNKENSPAKWSTVYPSVFRRNSLGIYDITKQYFMPVVRDVPVFPDYDLKPGDKWKYSGHEAHDLRRAFNIPEPFIVPFEVEYTYIGKIQKNGKTLHHIQAEYFLIHNLPEEILKKNKKRTELFPVSTLGFSKQNLYWDNEQGNLNHYDEEFNIRLILNDGTYLDFNGTAKAEVTESKKLDKPKVTEELKEELNKLGVENANVNESEEGITISLENIQFLADSDVLQESEKEKLKKIAQILKKFNDKDFLISGHTALAGTKKARQELSEKRAEAVANFLLKLGLTDAHHIFTKGFGAEKPIAPNDSEENMSKNRRVEITILEK